MEEVVVTLSAEKVVGVLVCHKSFSRSLTAQEFEETAKLKVFLTTDKRHIAFAWIVECPPNQIRLIEKIKLVEDHFSVLIGEEIRIRDENGKYAVEHSPQFCSFANSIKKKLNK